MAKKIICGWLLGGLLVLSSSCDKNQKSTTQATVENENSRQSTAKVTTEDDLVKKGKIAYIANCIACHHSDPAQNGPLGPPVKGASLELIQLRLLEAKYPEGYVPKRNTKIMQPLPHLKNNIEGLHAFLNQ